MGSKRWAEAMVPRREDMNMKEKTVGVDRTSTVKVVRWGKTEERDWNEVAPLQWGGQGKNTKTAEKQPKTTRGDDVSSQRRVRGKQKQGVYSLMQPDQSTKVKRE